MERRNLLIGTGAVLVTALAGCSESETDGDEGASDSVEGLDDSDDTDEYGDDGPDADDDKKKDDEKHDDEEHDDQKHEDDKKYDDIPGFDPTELSIASEHVHIDLIKRDGRTVSIQATATTIDPEELYEKLESLGHDVSAPTYDLDQFKQEIDTVELTVSEKKGDEVISFYIRVDWISKYMNDELTNEEFLDLVRDTVE